MRKGPLRRNHLLFHGAALLICAMLFVGSSGFAGGQPPDDPSSDTPADSPSAAPADPSTSGAEEGLSLDDSAGDSSAGGGGADESASGSGGRRSLLDNLVEGGPVGLIIVLLSMVSVGFIIEHFLTIRRSVIMPDHVVAELEELIHQGHIDQAVEVCFQPQNQSLFASVVASGLERFQASEFGFAEYKAACEEAGEDQTGRLYRKTEVLGVIGAIAPMLGLTGTVLGMITAFNTIADKGGMAKPDELAGGIGQALVTTLMGLFVAIPTMVFFSYFRNKIDSLVAEAGKRVEQVMMPLGRRK